MCRALPPQRRPPAPISVPCVQDCVDECFEGCSLDEADLALLEQWLLPDTEADLPHPACRADTLSRGLAPPAASHRGARSRRSLAAPVRCAPCTPPLAQATVSVSPFARTANSEQASAGRRAPPLAAAPAAAATAGDAAGVLGWLEGWGKLAEELGCAASSSTVPSSSQDYATSPGACLFADASVRLSCNMAHASRPALPHRQDSARRGSPCNCTGSCACRPNRAGRFCCDKRKRVGSEPRPTSLRPRTADWPAAPPPPLHSLPQLAAVHDPIWLL